MPSAGSSWKLSDLVIDKKNNSKKLLQGLDVFDFFLLYSKTILIAF